MTGLEEIRAMIAIGRRPPMMELLDIDLVEVDRGHVVFAATPSETLYNPMGIVHGGFAATMLDSACGLAAHSMTETVKNCVTLELKVAYHRAMDRHTGPVQAIGRIISMGSRIAHTEARLVGADGQLYASATSTLLVSERSAAGS
jgi:uncharacterized protein (TIGR00369 family)